MKTETPVPVGTRNFDRYKPSLYNYDQSNDLEYKHTNIHRMILNTACLMFHLKIPCARFIILSRFQSEYLLYGSAISTYYVSAVTYPMMEVYILT